jgi:hypothetical protein
MANITSVKSGLWSDPTVWDSGTVPANGDSVTIASGHTVTFNVDQSGFSSGLAGLTINGTLTFIADGTRTYLKMAGNITGSGAFYVGTQANPIPPSTDGQPTATIAFNGAYQVTGTLTIELWGEQRAPGYPIASKVDNYTIVLQGTGRLEWLRANDRIGISNSTIQDRNSPPDESFLVASYNPDTRTITLDSSTPLTRAVNQNGATDYVVCLTRSIWVTNLVGQSANTGFVYAINYGKALGVRFSNFGRGPIRESNGWTITSCIGQNNTQGGIAHWGSGHTITSCIGQNNAHGGIAHWGSGHTITSCIGQNNAYGGIVYWGSGCIITSCIGQNNTEGGIAHWGSGHTITSCIGQNNTQGGIVYWGSGHSIRNCITDGSNTGATLSYVIAADCYNSTFGEAVEVAGYAGIARIKLAIIRSFDHDQVLGNVRAWCRGGVVYTETTPAPPGRFLSYRHACESASYPVRMDWDLSVDPGELLRVKVWMRKDTAMAWLPRVQLIDPAQDPLASDSAQPLAERVMTDSVNTWEQYYLTWRNTTGAPKKLVLRTIAMNAIGNAWFDWDILTTKKIIA